MSWVADVGVDIEHKNDEVEIALLADLVFCQREAAFFIQLAAEEKIAYFYDVWTKKEALIKAGGWGLSYPMNKIDTTSLHENRISLSSSNSGAPKAHWYCYALQTAKGYSAALASKRPLDKPIGLVRASQQLGLFDRFVLTLPENVILSV